MTRATAQRLAGLALVALTGVLAVGVEPASACSCALRDPRSALRGADAAFVGVFVGSRRLPPSGPISGVDASMYTFRVEETLKGSLGEVVEVRSASSGASCGIEADPGERVGLLLYLRDGVWTSGLCDQLPPERLREAARPLPPPDGSGPAAFLVGGRFGDARTLALDRQGRTVAYGAGPGETLFFSVCPGGTRAAEVVVQGTSYRVAVRDLRTFKVVRETVLPFAQAPRYEHPSAAACGNATASTIYVFASNGAANGGTAAHSRLVKVAGGKVTTVRAGQGFACALARDRAYVSAGALGSELLEVRLSSGAGRRVARVPPRTGALALSPDQRRLAGLAQTVPARGSPARPRAVLVDLRAGAAAKVKTAGLGSADVTGKMIWLDSRRLAFFPRGGESDTVRVYDTSLRLLSRFGGWSASDAVVRAGVAYGISAGTIRRARLPKGPVVGFRELPSPQTYGLASVPGTSTRTSAAGVPKRSNAGTEVGAAVLLAALVLGRALLGRRSRALAEQR